MTKKLVYASLIDGCGYGEYGEYFDAEKSGYCCVDLTLAVEQGLIRRDEDGDQFFLAGSEDQSMSEHPIYCCPFCSSYDFETNYRMERKRRWGLGGPAA